MFRFEMDGMNEPLTVDAEELHCTKVQAFKSHYIIYLTILKGAFIYSVSDWVSNKDTDNPDNLLISGWIFGQISVIWSVVKFSIRSDIRLARNFFRYLVSRWIFSHINGIRSDYKFSIRSDIRPSHGS